MVIQRVDGTFGRWRAGLGGGGSVRWQDEFGRKLEPLPLRRTEAQALRCPEPQCNPKEDEIEFVVCETPGSDGPRFGTVSFFSTHTHARTHTHTRALCRAWHQAVHEAGER